MSVGHSPLPWRHYHRKNAVGFDEWFILDSTECNTLFGPEAAENADRIVHCVNVHDELVAAVRLAVDAGEAGNWLGVDALDALRALLAKVGVPVLLLLALTACDRPSPAGPSPTPPPDPLFDRSYYTQLVHNGGSEPRRVQSSAPRFLLRTMDDTGAAVDAASLDLAEAALTSEVVPAMTGGRYAATVRRDDGGLLPGEIAVNWVTTLPATTCGRSAVGGHLLMLHHVPQCGCAPGVRTNARLVKHEVGHVLGFWHTDGDDLMADAPTGNACDAVPTAREQHHAAISYEGGR